MDMLIAEGASGTELIPKATEGKTMTVEWLQLSDSSKSAEMKRNYLICDSLSCR